MEKALYVVATPIGNLEDISQRALSVLNQVDLIAAEDTRHSKKLLNHFNISTKLISYHDHNEDSQAKKLIDIIETNKSIALISDAGTPLISDPGYTLVATARENNIKVIPIPGSCALISALSVSGLPTDKFLFSGFLPAKEKPKIDALKNFLFQEVTVIFYESSHRIIATLESVKQVLGEESRKIFLAREISKKFETYLSGNIDHILNKVLNVEDNQKGEFVLIIEGKKRNLEINAEVENTIKILCQELPLKQAVNLAAKITNINKNTLYKHALSLNSD